MKYLKVILIFFLFDINLNAQEYTFNQLKSDISRFINATRFDEALELLHQYRISNPNDCRVYIEIANVYKYINNSAQIKKTYLDGIESATNCKSEFYFKLGMICYSTGYYKDAVLYLRQFFNSTPASEINSKYITTYKIMGISYYLTAEYKNAIEYFNRAVEVVYNDEEIYKYLSIIYLKTGDKNYSDAFLELNNLLLDNKNIPRYNFFRVKASIFFRNIKYGDAKTNLIEIYNDNRTDYTLNYNLGLTYFFNSQYDDAIRYLKKAVKFYENNKPFTKSLSRILNLDKTGAKYLLTLSMVYFFNKNYSAANNTFEKIKEYDSSIYKKYKNQYTGGTDSMLYKELLNAWEY